jgi:hypothetical protein
MVFINIPVTLEPEGGASKGVWRGPLRGHLRMTGPAL